MNGNNTYNMHCYNIISPQSHFSLKFLFSFLKEMVSRGENYFLKAYNNKYTVTFCAYANSFYSFLFLS
jgi:hypothetical protein